MRRLCACGCGADLAGMKRTAKWASPACSTAWSRLHPGQSRTTASSPNTARTRKRSGTSIRIGYRPAVEAVAAAFQHHGFGIPDAVARERARQALLPLVSPKHQETVANEH